MTAMETDTRMVRALSPRMGSLLAAERSMNGTSLGTIGKKSPAIFTLIRVVFAVLGAKLASDAGSGEPAQ